MPELIERGYIYIGQPPLYKIKQGKQENYLKDDAELNEYLLSRAMDSSALVFDPDSPALQGEGLENLTRDYMSSLIANKRLSVRNDPVFLSKLLDSERFSTDWNKDRVGEWCKGISARMNLDTPPSVKYALMAAEGEEGIDLLMERTTHGVTDTRKISRDFFRSPDYRLIGRVAEVLFGLIQEGAKVHRGKSEQVVETFDEAYRWLMQESRKGRTIQRFKGLGEMNPEQLWDTTVNPETRRLLQVTIEDAYVADEVFTTLMGDEVEPRREFIESNALEASNLDI